MDELRPSRVLGRRRRENAPGGRTHFHRVGVTPEEEGRLARLAQEAGGITIPRLLVERALDRAGGDTASERRSVMVELFALRRQLSGVASNVNQLARRVNAGDGFPVEEARDLLRLTYDLALRIDDAIDRLAAAGVRA